ncbi:transposase [Prevotella sp. HUN102]|uniref:transposase n=1 Tax=Prevotella sp. HUN102 TaxID=1392486 RepID=UPI001E2ACCAE|nr:transposase [Prevotella sp. HUN102]
MVCTDNFRRFSHDPRKISCYCGTVPFGDSGTGVHTDPHVHYMANRQIKAMLTQAALAAVNFNPSTVSYYPRLVARGKKKQVAFDNVRNKLIHIVAAMVRNGQVFDKDYKISA